MAQSTVSKYNNIGFFISKLLYHGSLGGSEDLQEIATQLNEEMFMRQRMGIEDLYGDGDQSMVSGEKSQILRFQWADGGDYRPFVNKYLSQWCLDCFNGDLKAVRKHLETDPAIMERRESVIRLSGIFHVIAGAKTINPAVPLSKEFAARVTHDTDHLVCAKFLIDKGANIHARDIAGNTPLHFAMSGYGNNLCMEIAKILLEHGADINAKNRMGCTPLFEPVMSSRFEFVDFLIEHGADVDVEENDGVSLLTLTNGCYPRMASRLSQAMAQKASKLLKEARLDGKYRTCANCKKANDIFRCTGCYMVWYCNVACQKEDWPNHKSSCKTIKKNYKRVTLVGSEVMENLSFMEKKTKIYRKTASTGENLPPNSHFIVKIQITLTMLKNRKQSNEKQSPRNQTSHDLLVYNKGRTLLGSIKPEWEHYEELVNIILEQGFAANSKGFFCAFYHEKEGLKINISNIQLPQPW